MVVSNNPPPQKKKEKKGRRRRGWTNQLLLLAMTSQFHSLAHTKLGGKAFAISNLYDFIVDQNSSCD